MRIGILGGRSVGQTLDEGFSRMGHEVALGTREVTEETLAQPRAQARPLAEWARGTGLRVVTLAEAAEGAEVVVSATNGRGSVGAVRACGPALDGKVLIDVSNPLDFSRGVPPFLLGEHSGATSLAEAIQAEALGRGW